VKVSPGWLIFEPRSWRRVTAIWEPAGITSGGGGAGAGAGADVAGAGVADEAGAGVVALGVVAGAPVVGDVGAGAAAVWLAGVCAGAGFSLVAC
jgi:hypothetical protein